MSNKHSIKRVVVTLLLSVSMITNAFAQTANGLCTPGGYMIGFFNGVFNTKAMALNGLQALKMIDIRTEANGERVVRELFYNTSGINPDRPDATGFEDLVEVFKQRAAEGDGLIDERWELFWDAVTGNTGPASIWGQITSVISSTANLVAGILDDNRTKKIAKLIEIRSNPPTFTNYAEHRTLLDSHITQKEKLVLVAHSQGNLFMNAAFEYAKTKHPEESIKAVHIAPASPQLKGPHTLAQLDLVINGLRLTGSVPSNTVNIPGILVRPEPYDWSGHELILTYLDSRMAPFYQISEHLKNAVASAEAPPSNGPDTNGFFTVTLTWDGSGDIDLHTFEPQGSHVYYQNRRGQVGELDTDNTTANGPEHYYASCDAEKLQFGTYRVGINNYSDGLGRVATVMVSTKKDGVLLTRSLDVGPERGSSGNSSPLPAANVNISKDPITGDYKVVATQ